MTDPAGRWYVTAIDVDECCSYVTVGAYESEADIPQWAYGSNYEITFEADDDDE